LVPVKFNKEYTVAIDCAVKYEIMCVLYKNGIVNQANYGDESSYEPLMSESLKSINGSSFYNPFIYSTKFDCAKDCWQNESCLYMLIKLPTKINSSIVVLEGNYYGISNTIGGLISPETQGICAGLNPTKLSVLSINNGSSYPFADRLVEYLFKNAIVPTEKIEKNIGRVQEDLVNLHNFSMSGMLYDI
jgi:hypothetical protein